VGDQAGLDDLVDVGLKRERGDISLEALGNRAGLRARALV
jgi:hypothetical protein